MPAERDRRAFWSLVCGLASVLIPICAIAGVILGIQVLRNISRRPWVGGKGQAIGGIVASVVLLPISLAIAIPTFLGASRSHQPADAVGTPTSDAPYTSPPSTSSLLPFPATYAHFSASFPSSPLEQTIPESIGGIHMTLYVAASKVGPVEVAEEDIDTTLPADQVDAALQASLRSVAAAANLTITGSPVRTIYRTFEAYTGTYSSSVGTIQAMDFCSSSSRLYLLIASPDTLTALKASLQLDS